MASLYASHTRLSRTHFVPISVYFIPTPQNITSTFFLEASSPLEEYFLTKQSKHKAKKPRKYPNASLPSIYLLHHIFLTTFFVYYLFISNPHYINSFHFLSLVFIFFLCFSLFFSLMTNRDDNGASFQAFLQGWLVRQQHHLDELLSVLQHCHESRDEDLKELINRVLAHYHQYYEEKSKIAHLNVFLVFSPTWFTTLERAFLWIAGFKPGLAFGLVTDSVGDLSEEQRQRMNRLMNETKVEERALNDELAKIQESVAAPPLLNAVKRRGLQSVDGEVRRDETAMEAFKTAMETVLTGADSLRITTALKVVEILSPTQNLKFLAAATQLQLKIRGCGLERR